MLMVLESIEVGRDLYTHLAQLVSKNICCMFEVLNPCRGSHMLRLNPELWAVAEVDGRLGKDTRLSSVLDAAPMLVVVLCG